MKTEIIIVENQSIVTFNHVPASYQNSFICAVLKEAADAEIVIDMIAQSPATSDKISFGFSFADDDMPKLLAIINAQEGNHTYPPLINCGNVKITVKSGDMIEHSGFASKMFEVLKKLQCLPLLVTTGIDEISVLVYENYSLDLESELREAFSG